MHLLSTPTRRRVRLRPTLVFAPLLMSAYKQCPDGLSVLTCVELCIFIAMGKIDRRILIGMCRGATDDTTKRLLVRSILSLDSVTHATLLRGIRTLDGCSSHPSLGRLPGDLFGNVREVRGP